MVSRMFCVLFGAVLGTALFHAASLAAILYGLTRS